MANNSSPQIRRATALALLNITTNVGAVASTWILGVSKASRFFTASITLLAFQFGIIACSGANLIWLVRENRRKAKIREATEETPLLPSELRRGDGDEGPLYEYSL